MKFVLTAFAFICCVSVPSARAAIGLTMDLLPLLTSYAEVKTVPPVLDIDTAGGEGVTISASTSSSISAEGAFSSATITGSTELLANTFTSSFSASGNWSPNSSIEASAGVAFVWQIRIVSSETFVFTWNSTGDYFVMTDMGAVGGKGTSGSIEVAPGNYWITSGVSYSGNSLSEPGSFEYSGTFTALFTPVPEPAVLALFVVSLGALAAGRCHVRKK